MSTLWPTIVPPPEASWPIVAGPCAWTSPPTVTPFRVSVPPGSTLMLPSTVESVSVHEAPFLTRTSPANAA